MEKQNDFNLKIYFGNDTAGEKFYLDFEKIPHFLAVGTTGSGKSEALRRVISEITAHYSSEEAKLLLIDTKFEFDDLNDLPNLFSSIVDDMDAGIAALAEVKRLVEERRGEAKAPCLFVVIDELMDLMYGERRETAIEVIRTITQSGAAANVHLLAATQVTGGSSSKIIPYGLFPCRLIGRVSYKKESKKMLGDETAMDLYPGEMILLTPTERTRLHVLRAGI